MNKISIDFRKTTGKVKPVHSVCCAPYGINFGPDQQHIQKLFTEANIPYCRLHDCCFVYGGTYFVDIPNIFRDFDADENDPASYDFHYTDEYIGAVQAAGTEAYYRLGITIEWGSKKYTTAPPKDFAKWARICEHIIMHYNQGWADGFEYGIKYWEIWNEPENPGNRWGKSMWEGTKEEFFDLYKITSKHLKSKFPEIKVGGYGGCGFYAITRKDVPQSRHDFVTYFTDFLQMAKAENCPLDFYSWHIYTADESELLAHAKYVRETLDDFGFTDTESHLNEWNINAEGTGFAAKHTMEGGSFNGAVLCMLQNTRYVDMAHYYCFSIGSIYNGFMDNNTRAICPAWYPFVAFGNLYKLGNAAEITCDCDRVYSSAAKSDGEYAVLVSNYMGEDDKVSVHIDGCENGKTVHALYITDDISLEEQFSFSSSASMDLSLKLPKHTVVLLEIK